MTLVDRPVVLAPRSPETTRSRSPAAVRAAPVLLAVLAAGVLHLLWWLLLASSGGDMAAQDAWAAFARTHPGSAYNLAWYGGMHPVSYSVLSPYVMAVLGVRPTMVIAGTLSAGLLAWLAVRPAPAAPHRWWPALYGAVALAGNAVSGRTTFALGTCFALVAVCVVAVPGPAGESARRRRTRLAAGTFTAAVAAAASPVAGLFLGLVAATLWLDRRRTAAYVLGLPPLAVVTLSALLFPFSGEQPMGWGSTILPAVVGVGVVVLTPRDWRLLRLGAAVYLVAVALAWLVPSPVGTNVSRLGLLFGGVALVSVAALGEMTTSIAWRRLGGRVARVLLALAILTSTAWQVGTAARDAANGSPPESWKVELTALVDQLESRDADLGRVEVIPTRSHREAAALAPHVNLARGWNRQADAERNPIFYRDQPLDAASYHRWLQRWAVRYVVLSTAPPDPAAVAESDLVAGGLSYLTQVWTDDDWTLFEVRHPTPLVSPPARVLAFDAAEITLYTPEAGDVVVRVPDSPWLSLVDQNGDPLDSPGTASGGPDPEADGQACLSDLETDEPFRTTPRADDWLVLHAPRAGIYRIAAPYKLPRGSSCG